MNTEMTILHPMLSFPQHNLHIYIVVTFDPLIVWNQFVRVIDDTYLLMDNIGR